MTAFISIPQLRSLITMYKFNISFQKVIEAFYSSKLSRTQCIKGHNKVTEFEVGGDDDDDDDERHRVGCRIAASLNGHDNLYGRYQCELQTRWCVSAVIVFNRLSKHGQNKSSCEQDTTSREEKQTV